MELSQMVTVPIGFEPQSGVLALTIWSRVKTKI